jgi:Uma2 family endonuclease
MISGFTDAEELMTAAELARVDLPNKSTELVRGRLIVREPPGTNHGRVQSNLNFRVAAFVHAHMLGAVFGQDTGFKIASDPDTVRAPDLAFIARERVPLIPARGYAAMAPDLVAEILSPDDRAADVLAKIGEWLAAGVRLAWVIDPERVTAQAYRADGSVAVIASDGALDGEGVLPGFRCSLRELCE